MATTQQSSRGDVTALRDAGITFFTGVPDSAFRELIADLEGHDLDDAYVLATREDNAVALAVGAYLAGEQPLVFMESSGVGNAIDALTSLAIVGRVPLVVLIAWAGYRGRDVPHHNAIGEPLEGVLEALRVPVVVTQLGRPPEVVGAAVAEAVGLATSRRRPVAVLGIPASLETASDES